MPQSPLAVAAISFGKTNRGSLEMSYNSWRKARMVNLLMGKVYGD